MAEACRTANIFAFASDGLRWNKAQGADRWLCVWYTKKDVGPINTHATEVTVGNTDSGRRRRIECKTEEAEEGE